MLFNLILILLVFGSSRKKKLKPYMAGLILGGIKAVVYLVFTRSILDAIFTGIVFGVLGALLVHLFDRLDQKPKPQGDPAKMYQAMGTKKGSFQWEYIPIVGIVLLLIGGETVLTIALMARP